MSLVQTPPTLTRQQAIAIAEADGIAAYGDLDHLTLEVSLQDDGWHVDYWMRKPRWAGGGPHYVIDAATGAILTKRYEQ